MSAVSEQRPAGGDQGFAMAREAWLELFAALATGDGAALERLYDVAARPLFGLAAWRTGSPEDAADVVHEVFVRLVETRDTLGRVRDPRAWLLAVTHRAAVDVTRRRAVRRAETLDDTMLLEAPLDDRERALDARRASALLARLPARQREAIYLHHYADCTFRIGAEAMYLRARGAGKLELALVAAVVAGEAPPQKLLSSERITRAGFDWRVRRDGSGMPHVEPRSQAAADEAARMAETSPDRRFRFEAIAGLQVLRQYGAEGNRERAAIVLERLAADHDPVISSWAAWARDHDIPIEQLEARHAQQ